MNISKRIVNIEMQLYFILEQNSRWWTRT